MLAEVAILTNVPNDGKLSFRNYMDVIAPAIAPYEPAESDMQTAQAPSGAASQAPDTSQDG